MYAPSGMNKQPWEFIVCLERETLDEIQKIHPYSQMLKTAPCCIIAAGDTNVQYAQGSYIQDCAAAVENLLLGAASLGLGSCWLGVYPDENRQEAFRKLFNMPSHIAPFCAIALWYPDEHKEMPDRFNADKVHFEKWQLALPVFVAFKYYFVVFVNKIAFMAVIVCADICQAV